MAELVGGEVLRGRYRFCGALGGWLRWTGHLWEGCADEVVIEAVRAFTKKLLVESLDDDGGPDRQRLLRLQNKGPITNVVTLTRGLTGILTSIEEFDADPWVLHCPNGVLDVRSLELKPPDPSRLNLKITAVEYDKDVHHDDLRATLGAFPDAETMRWAQQFLATGIVGVPPTEDIIAIWHGSGSNGKSTILGSVRACLGTYAAVLLPSVLGGRREEHPTELMDLHGLRLGVVEELNDGHKMDVAKMKRITGSSTITARRMRRDPIEFKASHTLVVASNYRPVVPDTDHGTWRRLRMVPFPKEFGRGLNTVDRGLRTRMTEEPAQLRAMLNWLIVGAHRWYRAGKLLPATPEAVQAATQEWRASSDLIAGFAAERLRCDPGRFTETKALLDAFNDEFLPTNSQPWTMRTFSERLENHDSLRELGGVKAKHPKSRRSGFTGVALRYPEEG
jgi:P4 family phage/plasmid primase-like protien